MKRVVITGFGGFTPIGAEWSVIEQHLRNRKTGIVTMHDWDKYIDMHTRLAAPVQGFEQPAHYTRKRTRSMGRVALLATVASERALAHAGLLDDPEISNGSMGVAYGSCTGSTSAAADFFNLLVNHTMDGITANTYLKMMGHTTAVNVGVFFELKGRVIPTSSACTSGSQGIGYAYEAIRYGKQLMMVAGGAEELCPTEAAVFDTLYATSTMNTTPEKSPRPFDKERDGLVIGEGACSLILEELEHAQARGAPIYAEIVGFACNSDGAHVTQPSAATMRIAMELALKDAQLSSDAIGYICAHGTATEHGDIAESNASSQLFGARTPISSLKSYMGHTLGACGSIEAWLTIEMMNRNWFAPTVNLDNIDPRCGDLDYITGHGRELSTEYVMSNNFAFGGINTSLIFKRWS
ncbi:MAG: beta-ketoacyl-ACP synthase [Gammaproteobacteria bacterium]|nr:beta-ketoacyl-ACP synthase [Gammaproteobacteria bacterium]